MERRVITTDMMEEDIRIEGSLRPQCLDDYIGQEMHWIMYCFTDHPGLEKPHWRGLLPMKWEFT